MSSGILGKAAVGIGALVLGVSVLAGGAAAGFSGLLGGGGAGSAPPVIPTDYLALYQAAAATCPGLSWTVLAAIGTIESDNGHSDAPGVHSGANSAGAQGPMQFEPATFAAYATPVPPGGVSPASPYDPVDAIYAAARDLCANGARDGRDLPSAIYNYNHATWYVAQVLALAARYAQTQTRASTAVEFALAQQGVPYQWGGDGNGGFDCSGLTQAAYKAAGIALPRTAQQQYDAGPPLPPGTPLLPGDLVFYGTRTTAVTHVGIVIDTKGNMVDAPHTGAVVRVERIWSGMLGATRPAG
ncbi:MAG: C40 family peptidase [Actinomycetes bacterium]